MAHPDDPVVLTAEMAKALADKVLGVALPYGWHDALCSIASGAHAVVPAGQEPVAWEAKSPSATRLFQRQEDAERYCQGKFPTPKLTPLYAQPPATPAQPDVQPIIDSLPQKLDGGETCPLCGRDGQHQHTPAEIVIFKNGVTRGYFMR